MEPVEEEGSVSTSGEEAAALSDLVVLAAAAAALVEALRSVQQVAVTSSEETFL